MSNDLLSIPCVLMRGGTSKGPFFLASDLPADTAERDRLLLEVMGSGHPLQIDGIGGGNALTSKVAIIDRSSRADADVDYLFAQVRVEQQVVDTSPNCGNMLAAVGPYAIERGLVQAQDPQTEVRIHNVNTGKLIIATVETPGGMWSTAVIRALPARRARPRRSGFPSLMPQAPAPASCCPAATRRKPSMACRSAWWTAPCR
jgi:2-methylaconitate cis-trans-isomerase PrpF